MTVVWRMSKCWVDIFVILQQVTQIDHFYLQPKTSTAIERFVSLCFLQQEPSRHSVSPYIHDIPYVALQMFSGLLLNLLIFPVKTRQSKSIQSRYALHSWQNPMRLMWRPFWWVSWTRIESKSHLHFMKLTKPWKIHHFDGVYKETWGFSWAMLVSGRVHFLKLTAKAPEHGWLGDDPFILGFGLFSGANC